MKPAPPGIGAAAAEAADVISGIGDVLLCFALCIERLGLDRAEQIGILDRLIGQLDEWGETQRAVVPRALRAVLLPLPDHPGDERFRVIAGGRQDAPNAAGRS